MEELVLYKPVFPCQGLKRFLKRRDIKHHCKARCARSHTKSREVLNLSWKHVRHNLKI